MVLNGHTFDALIILSYYVCTPYTDTADCGISNG